ncbi:calcium-dependent phosphotriesterase [Hymenopellis radicata]|nr:calcium-dependent phosphotriesterase [Hymenopellis radicata]
MGALVTILTVFAVVAAAVYQLYVSPLMKLLGVGRTVQVFGHSDRCYTVPEVPGCEKLVLHHASGTLYMSCSTLAQRAVWLNPSKTDTRPFKDANYIATYDHAHRKATRVILKDFPWAEESIAFHGMDVVPSSLNHNELFVYLVHHRLPPPEQDPASVGFHSTVEVFRTFVGSDTLTHISTVDDPVHMLVPNDVLGSSDGKSFFFTNSGTMQTGFTRNFRELLNPSSTVVYCHGGQCKVAISGLSYANGITAAPNGTVYIASTIARGIRVLDRQEDNSLVLDDLIPTEEIFDNLSIDEDGILWGAGIPRAFDAVDTMKNSSIPCPSIAKSFAINTGTSSFYGEKYKIDTVFSDDGNVMSLLSTVVHDSQRHMMYYHGLLSRWLLVCPSP